MCVSACVLVGTRDVMWCFCVCLGSACAYSVRSLLEVFVCPGVIACVSLCVNIYVCVLHSCIGAYAWARSFGHLQGVYLKFLVWFCVCISRLAR